MTSETGTELAPPSLALAFRAIVTLDGPLELGKVRRPAQAHQQTI